VRPTEGRKKTRLPFERVARITIKQVQRDTPHSLRRF